MRRILDTLLPPRDCRPRLTAEERLAIEQHPVLGRRKDAYFRNLVFLAGLSGAGVFHRLLFGEARRSQLAAQASTDPFQADLPAAARFRTLKPGWAPLLYLATGAILSLPFGLDGTALHMLIVGPTGSGKTNAAITLIWNLTGCGVIVVLDSKGEMAKLARLNPPGDVVVLNALELLLSFSDGLTFLDPTTHVANLVDILASTVVRPSATRLLAQLIREEGEARGWKELSALGVIGRLAAIDAARSSNLGGQRDSTLLAMRSMLARTGAMFTSAKSSFLDRMFARPATFIINTGGLTPSHESLLARWIIRFIYEQRRVSRQTEPPVLFVVDDALEIVSATKSREAEGRLNPITRYATMSRAFNVGFCVLAQSFGVVSPILRGNCNTVMTSGCYGEDAAQLARHLGLTPEQATVLPTLGRGRAVGVSRNQWPYPVYGLIPEIV